MAVLLPAVATLAAALVAALGGGCRAGITRGNILYADARESLAQGDSLRALALLQEAAHASPKDARVHALLGELTARAGTYEARAAAERSLRRAVDLDPSVGGFQAALGEVLHEQGFSTESRDRLSQGLALDPTLSRAWYLLGVELLAVWREEPEDEALADSTRSCFERCVAADPTHEEARYQLASFDYFRGQVHAARATVAARTEAPDSTGRWGLLRTAIERRLHREPRAQAILDSTLAALRPGRRDSLLTPRRLVHPDSVPCRDCSLAQRDSANTHFWWALDPTPATAQNERLLEHAARLVEADVAFSVPRLGLAGRDTDRGEVWLRYGPPLVFWREFGLQAYGMEVRAWVWNYEVDGEPYDIPFVDTYHNTNYLRVRRGATGDFMHLELLEAVAERTQIDMGPPIPGWRSVVRRFRDPGGGTALEIAFGFDATDEVDRVELEMAGWVGPGKQVVSHARAFASADLYPVGRGRGIGRLRVAIPHGWLATGLQATATRLAQGRTWFTSERDTIDTGPAGALDVSDLVLAHLLRRGTGGIFDLGGVDVVPRVDHEVTGPRLHLYFEIYPGAELRARGEVLRVTYRVRPLPPREWRFRDQFSAAARARRNRHIAVESSFRLPARREIERAELAIDLRAVGPGEYALEVDVATADGTLVERSAEFTLVEPPAPTP